MLVRRLLPIALACSCLAPLAHGQTSAAAQAHIDHVTSGLLPGTVLKSDPHPRHTLAERMAATHVPGVSIAVIHNGVIEWAQGFGVTRIGGPPVTAATLFQAGSISKPVAALAALRLVQAGKLSLDADVNSVLKSWKLPDDPKANGKPVTLRELLTHTGGTTVHGFPGYASDAPVPTLLQVLNGEKPANTPAIRIEAQPGTRFNYSGGGFTIIQQMLIDVSGQDFPKLLENTVLKPIGMTSSTYRQPLPADRAPLAATPYDGAGKPIPGGAHTYPELAAAGLWTTPSDLARYAIEIELSLQGKANHVLSPETTREMLTPGLEKWGLGIETGGSPQRPFFTHGGVNEGFESLLLAYQTGGEGAIIMTDAQGGSELAAEIMRSIAAEYGWPDYQPTLRSVVTVDPVVLATYAGTYGIAPSFDLVVTVVDGHLVTQATNQPSFPLEAESPTKFFPLAFDAELEFVKDAQGNVSTLILRQGGHEVRATRK